MVKFSFSRTFCDVACQVSYWLFDNIALDYLKTAFQLGLTVSRSKENIIFRICPRFLVIIIVASVGFSCMGWIGMSNKLLVIYIQLFGSQSIIDIPLHPYHHGSINIGLSNIFTDLISRKSCDLIQVLAVKIPSSVLFRQANRVNTGKPCKPFLRLFESHFNSFA